MRPYRRAIMCGTQCLTMLKEPYRWTRSTASHSSSVMLKTMRSRRMPAALQRTSTRPYSSTAVRTIAPAESKSATESKLATAFAAGDANLRDDVGGRAGRGAGAVNGAAQVVDHHGGALLREQQRHGAADSAASARHYGHSAFQPVAHQRASRSPGACASMSSSVIVPHPWMLRSMTGSA